MWTYEEYVEKREEFIKKGMDFPEASEKAHKEVNKNRVS